MMKSSIKAFLGLAATAWLLLPAPYARAEDDLQVLTTIAPLYMLTAGVMDGVGTPDLLMQAGDSPHHFSLTPQGAQKIAAADIVICTSEKLELYIQSIMPAFENEHHSIIEALEIPGVNILPATPDADDGDEMDEGLADVHFWLNPVNAIAYTQYISQELSAIDSAHAMQYEANATKQIARLKALDAAISKQLGSVPRHAHYASYHPSLAYFEQRYHIAGGHAVTRSPESGASAAEATTLQQHINSGSIRCLFREPEFSPRLLEQAAAHSDGKAEVITLDPLGNTYPLTAQSYDAMLQDIATHVAACSEPVEGSHD